MKKTFFVSLALLPLVLQALPVMNAADPALQKRGLVYSSPRDTWSLRAAFRGDYVYNHALENENAVLNRYQIFANEGLLTLNLRDRVDIYGFAGSATQNFSGVVDNNTGGSNSLSSFYPSQLIWGFGVKGLLWQINDTRGLGKFFLTLSLDYQSIKKVSPSTLTLNGNLANIEAVQPVFYTETQFALSFGYRIGFLVPYAAFTWDNARANMPLSTIVEGGRSSDVINMTPSELWGFAIGTTLVSYNTFTVTAEARFITEKALTLEGSFKF